MSTCRLILLVMCVLGAACTEPVDAGPTAEARARAQPPHPHWVRGPGGGQQN